MNMCWVSRLVERKGKKCGGWKVGDHEVTQPVSVGIVVQWINDKNIFSISSIFSTATLQQFEYGYELNVTGFSLFLVYFFAVGQEFSGC